MKCKDCVHYDICKDEYKDKLVCSEFKNKADYAEVKYGEWIAKPSTHISKRGRIIHYDRYKCSECGVWNGRHKPDYCPHCGAKMSVNYKSTKNER